MTQFRSILTLSEFGSTLHPAFLRIDFASSFINSIPISSKIRIAVLWIFSTPSNDTGSMKLSLLMGSDQGVWEIEKGLLFLLFRDLPPGLDFLTTSIKRISFFL